MCKYKAEVEIIDSDSIPLWNNAIRVTYKISASCEAINFIKLSTQYVALEEIEATGINLAKRILLENHLRSDGVVFITQDKGKGLSDNGPETTV